jgi:hypothetical protein
MAGVTDAASLAMPVQSEILHFVQNDMIGTAVHLYLHVLVGHLSC